MKRLGQSLLLLATLGLQALSTWFVVGEAGALALIAHILASAVGVGWLVSIAPARLSPSDAVGIFTLIFGLPLAGLVAIGCFGWPAWRRSLAQDRAPRVYEFGVGRQSPVYGVAATEHKMPLREVLTRSEDATVRLEAVLTLRGMPDHRAVPILRQAFSDPSEEVRLSAFADLERRESRLRGVVKERLAKLEGQSDAELPRRAAWLRALADAHWELVYCGFAAGVLETSTLKLGANYAAEALQLEPHGATAILLARMLLRLRQPGDACRALFMAEQSGVAPGVCAPLFAEANFALRRLHAVGAGLAATPQTYLQRASLGSVAELWARQEPLESDSAKEVAS